MLRKQILILCFFALVFSPALISAQPTWTLEKCIEYALENSINLKQVALNTQNTALTHQLNKSARLPNLNAGGSYGYNVGRSINPATNEFTTSGFQNLGVQLSSGVTVYNGGRITNSIKQSDLDLRAATEDLKATSNDLALGVANAYLSTLLAEEQLFSAVQRMKLTKEQLERTDKLIKVGVLPAANRLDILAQIAGEEQTVVIAQNAVDFSILNLKQIMQYPAEEPILLEKPRVLIPMEDLDKMTIEQLYNAALGNQPEIVAAEIRKESASIGIKIAESALYPNLSLNANLNSNYSNLLKRIAGFEQVTVGQDVIFNGQQTTIGFVQDVPILENNPFFNQFNENIGGGIGLSFGIPIYNRNQTKISIERAKLNETNSSLSAELAKQQLKAEVQNALADARAGKKRMEAAQIAVDAAKAAYDSAAKRYEVGASTSFELNSAKNRWELSKSELITSKYDYVFSRKVLDFYLGNPINFN